MYLEESDGFPASHPTPAQRIGDRAEGSGGGGPGDGVLHFPTDDGQESAPCPRAHRYLRQDGEVFEASHRDVGHAGGPSAHGRLEEKAGGAARTLVQGSARADSPQMRASPGTTYPRDVREG